MATIRARPTRLCDGLHLADETVVTPAHHAALRAIGYGSVRRPDSYRGVGYRLATIAECYEEARRDARQMVRDAFGIADFPDACDVHYHAPHGLPSGGVYFRARTRAEAETVIREAEANYGPDSGYKFWIEGVKP